MVNTTDSLRQQLARWNEQQRPAWRYQDVRNFLRDLLEARRQITASRFRLVGD